MKAGAQVIVTKNMRDFRVLPDGIEAQPPDEFLSALLDLDPERMIELVRAEARALHNPPRAFEDVVRGLGKVVPDFALSVAAHAGMELPW